MKKFGIFACAALATLCTARLSAAVESDIVGYTTITMEAGKWYQVGTPFAALDDDEVRTVNTVFNNGFANGDVLTIHNTDTDIYENSCYWIDGKGWCNNRVAAIARPVNYAIKDGHAVFIKKGDTTTTAVLSGKVVLRPVTFGLDAGQSWAQIVIPYPMDVKINDLTWENMSTGDTATIYNSETDAYENAMYWIDGKGWCNNRVAAIARPVDVTVNVSRAIMINKKSAGKGVAEIAQ